MPSNPSSLLFPSGSRHLIGDGLVKRVPILVLAVLGIQVFAGMVLYLDAGVDWHGGVIRGPDWAACLAGTNLLLAILLAIASVRNARCRRPRETLSLPTILLLGGAIVSLGVHFWKGKASWGLMNTHAPTGALVPAATSCGALKIRSLNGVVPQAGEIELVEGVNVVGGASPATTTTNLMYRPLDGGRWRRIEGVRLNDESWQASLALPMNGSSLRRFALLGWSCDSLPADTTAESVTVVARAARVTIDTTVAAATELTLHGTITGAPADAVICVLGRTDTTPNWKLLATAVPGIGRWTADVALRAPYERASHFYVTAVVSDVECGPHSFERPSGPVGAPAATISGRIPSPAVSFAVADRCPVPSGARVLLRGRAEHALNPEKVFVQAFPEGGGLPGVWPAVRSPETGTWEAAFDLPPGTWQLYAVLFDQPPNTLPRPTAEGDRVVIP